MVQALVGGGVLCLFWYCLLLFQMFLPITSQVAFSAHVKVLHATMGQPFFFLLLLITYPSEKTSQWAFTAEIKNVNWKSSVQWCLLDLL